MTIRIRIATRSDIDDLFDIRTSVRENYQSRAELAALGVTPATVAEMLASRSRAWIADVDSVPAAFAMADAEQGSVFALFVRPECEGRGLGQRLVREAEDWLFSQGFSEIWLLTGSEPELRAHGFYRRLGWIPMGVQPDGQIKYVKRADSEAR